MYCFWKISRLYLRFAAQLIKCEVNIWFELHFCEIWYFDQLAICEINVSFPQFQFGLIFFSLLIFLSADMWDQCSQLQFVLASWSNPPPLLKIHSSISQRPINELPSQSKWWTLVRKVVENNHLILKSDQACQLRRWQLLIWLTQNKCPISGVSSLSTLGNEGFQKY